MGYHQQGWIGGGILMVVRIGLLYTSDAADEEGSGSIEARLFVQQE